MKHKQYSLDDLLMDADFRKWILEPDASTSAFWETWLQNNPDKKAVVAEAREIILTVEFDEVSLPEAKHQALWEQLNLSIEADTTVKDRPLVHRMYDHWQKVAAVFIGVLLLSMAAWLALRSDSKEYRTDYGETQKIILPDSSMVTLNANSSLKIAEDWKSGSNRQVWLEGEAFFEVVHTVDNQKFLVHTDELNVEVLGTTFYVNNRPGNTKVVLNTGSIQLNTREETLLMAPGELIEFNERTHKMVKRVVNPETYIAWKDNLLVFKNTLLGEIARILEDNYNYEVEFEDPQIAEETFIGTFPADRIHVLVITLEKSMPLEVKGRTITFKKIK